MYKKILTIVCIITSLGFSKELKNEKFELLAKNIETKNKIVTAEGKVVVFSPTYYISADKIIYDKLKDSIEAIGNVVIIKDNNTQTQGDYAYVNLKDESYTQNPIFLKQNDSPIWAASDKSDKKENTVELNDTIISSCDCENPDWSIKVSSANYDTKDKWVNAYNPRFYFGNVPVFYLPYLGFPTDKTRRTGLLRPTLGYGSSDGLYYAQPIYFAPARNYDIELVPQLRSRRGYGAYAYLRYVDSPYSILKLQVGGFREDKDYQEANDLENQDHYGWNINYARTKLFANEKKDHQDGLYVDINNMNDVEYVTLENDDDTSTDEDVESKINYFYTTPEYYGGIYGKYYKDLDATSNDATLQELPQIQLHKYNNSIFTDKLLYSLDTKFYNYTRKEGVTARIYEATAPISYTQHFLDDYLYLTVANETTLSSYNYGNDDTDFENGKLIQNETSVAVGTDLIKPYDNYLHTMNLEAKYTHPENIKEQGDLYEITNDDDDLSVFPITQNEKNIKLSLNQYLYDKNSLKQIVNHKLSQSILYENNKPKLQDLENYLKYTHDFGTLSSKVVYNVQDKTIVENDSDMIFKYNNLSFDAGYYMSKNTDNSDREDLESYNYGINYRFAKDYSIGYYENYNIEEHTRSKQGIKLSINDICWNLRLKYERKITPSSSTSSDAGIDKKMIYLELELKSLGGIKQKYTIDEDK